MPMDYSKYPDNWREISQRIRFDRAGGKCERCGAEHGQPHPDTGKTVRLTTAHIGAPLQDGSPGDKTDKMDVREENLLALCDRCHMKEDVGEHLDSRKYGRNFRINQYKLF